MYVQKKVDHCPFYSFSTFRKRVLRFTGEVLYGFANQILIVDLIVIVDLPLGLF